MGFLNGLAVVIGIGFLIFVHELGHFLLAKLNGVRIDLFSLGFGPVLLSYRRGFGLQAGSSGKRYEEAQRKLREMLPEVRAGLARHSPAALVPPGQTEYRLALIPLGGFVKMAGEPLGEERTGAPDELTSKKPLRRFLIFVAGSVMNFLVAFPLCILAFAVGRNLAVPVLSSTPAPGSSEWEAGMTVGDRIVSVNGVPINHLEAYKKEILRAKDGQSLPVEIERGDPAQRITLDLIPRGADNLSAAPPSNLVDTLRSGSPGQKAELQPDDVVLELNGKRLLSHEDLQRVVKLSPGKPLPMKVFRPGTGGTLDLAVTPELNPDTHAQRVFDPGELLYEPVVRKIHALSAAKAWLREGDRILEINDKPMASTRDVQDIVQALPDQVATFKLLRAGDTKVEHCTVRRNALGRGTLDISLGAEGVPALGDVPSGSELAKAGAKKGDRLVAVDGWENLTVSEIRRNIEESLSKTVRVSIARAEGEPLEIELPIAPGPNGKKHAPLPILEAYPLLIEVPERWPLYVAGLRGGDRVLRLDIDGDTTLDLCTSLSDLDKAAKRKAPFPVEVERGGKPLAFTVTPGPVPYGEIGVGFRFQTVFHRYPTRQSIALGVREVVDITHLTFQILGKLVQGQAKTSDMAGPIGIIHASYNVIQQGFGNFLWLLGLIAVSLAIFNLFPIPILDGGHILFLLVEKIKGSPVSEKTQYRAQLVGLVLLLALLVLVTKNDITRLFRGF